MSHEARTSVALLTIVALLTTNVTYAQEYTSDSFGGANTITTDFGGTSTSTSFQVISGGGEISNTHSTSSSFFLSSGPVVYDTFTPVSQNWRWYDDSENATPSVALAAENIAPSDVTQDDVIKLRVSVAEIAGVGLSNTKFRLEFATSSNFVDGAYEVADIGDCTGTSEWCYADGGGDDDDLIPSALLTDADSCVANVGDGCGTHNESGTSLSSHIHNPSAVAEYEFTLTQSGTPRNTVYFFRLVETTTGAGVIASSTATYPSLVTEGARLTFNVNGLPVATQTEGVETTIETTPEGVNFGALPVGTSVTAAHRFAISTNAEQGYKIYVYQQQGLLHTQGSEIDPIDATNDTPAAWASGCQMTAVGCYGYHSGEDVLDGGSTRFAAEDSYARFDSTPREIAFNSGATTSKTTDIVYRVEVQETQAAGEYSGAIVYVIVPVF